MTSRIPLPALTLALLLPLSLPAQEPEGPAAQRTTLGGYGEVHYTNASGPASPGTVNLKRFVLYLGHQFSDRVTLHSELEVEDARIEGGDAGGEVALEQAYLEYAVADGLSLRGGLVLVPIGIVNEQHEPPTFNGVERPAFDHDVLPTTWRELGVGATGQVRMLPGVSWRAYLINGLRADGFTGGEGIREGRQEGREASFANPSLTGRLEYARPGLKVGTGFWYGGSANQDSLVGTGSFAAPVTVLAADLRYDREGFQLRGEAARIGIGHSDRINAANAADVGRRIQGFYLEAGYDALRLLAPGSAQQLVTFVRHERYDTHAATLGLARNPLYDRRITTVGLTWKPLWNVALKGDYQLRRNRAGIGEAEILALGLGYQF